MSYGKKISSTTARHHATPPAPPGLPPQQRTRKKPPTYTLDPMSSYTGPTYTHINWDNPTTHTAATHLAHQLTTGGSTFQLLSMPPGFGKTAIAIKTLALIQHHHAPVPHIIITSKSILAQHGWHATIASWNTHHPDNPIRPIIMDTFDRFSRILAHPHSFTDITHRLTAGGILVLDEAHSYKNPTSKRSKMLQKIPTIRTLGLSGTPLDNNIPFDAASYLIRAGYYRNKSDFMRKTQLNLHLDEWSQPDIYNPDGTINDAVWPAIHTVKEQLSHVIYAPDVTTVAADMPSATRHLIHQPMSRKMEEDLSELTHAYTSRMFDSVMDYYHAFITRLYGGPERANMVADIATKDTVCQPLIFFTNTSVRDGLVNEFTRRGIDIQIADGAHPMSTVNPRMDTPILIQYQAGGVGVEFPRSTATIIAQNHGSYSAVTQALGRNVRRGMDHNVDHYFIATDHPFDYTIMDRVEKRQELSQSVMADIAIQASGLA